MSRVVFLNRFYWPDEPATAQLLVDLAEGLAATGHEVTVIASLPPGPDQARDERRNGVRIRRIRTTRGRQFGRAGRVLDLATFFPGALWQLFRSLRRDDTVVAMTDPAMLGVGVWLVAALRGARLVHWVQDIYPEIAVTLTGHRWLKALEPLRNAAWRQAGRCVVPGEDMARVLAGAGVPSPRIAVSPNWAPRGLQPAAPEAIGSLRAAWGLTGKFVIGYSGNLGRVHDLLPLLDLADALRPEAGFAFVFIGGGPRRAFLEKTAADRGLTHVQFRPPQPRGNLAVALSVADLHAVTLHAGAEHYVFPSKLYGIAAVGRPVLFIGAAGSELAAHVERRGFGRAFARTDIAAIATWLHHLRANPAAGKSMAAAALDFSTGGFNRALKAWDRIVRGELAEFAPTAIKEASS